MNMQRCHERYGRLIIVNELKYRLDEIYPGTFVRYGPDKLLINSTHGLQGKRSTPCRIFASNGKFYW